MGKSYSMDLRERVVGAIDGGMSKMAAHRLFGISRSTIDDWLALREKTGSVAVVASRAGRVSVLRGAVFEEFVGRHRDATLSEMSQAWHQERGVALCPMAFCNALKVLGWTRKKRVGRIASATKVSARPLSKR